VRWAACAACERVVYVADDATAVAAAPLSAHLALLGAVWELIICNCATRRGSEAQRAPGTGSRAR
jgi:hypothetical protein